MNKKVLSRKKKPIAFSDYAKDLWMGLNISKEEYQKKVRDNLCLRCGKTGHFFGDCKGDSSFGLQKGRQS